MTNIVLFRLWIQEDQATQLHRLHPSSPEIQPCRQYRHDLDLRPLLSDHRVLASRVFLLCPSNLATHLTLANHLLLVNPSDLQQLNIKVSAIYT